MLYQERCFRIVSIQRVDLLLIDPIPEILFPQLVNVDCATLVICFLRSLLDASYHDFRWELTCGSVDAGVGAAVEAAEAEVGAVGVALARAPAVAHRARALGVGQRARRRALPPAAAVAQIEPRRKKQP